MNIAGLYANISRLNVNGQIETKSDALKLHKTKKKKKINKN